MKELIEQIGGRERLEFIAENAISKERSMMARALLAVLDAKPVGITDSSELGCLLRGEMANVMPPNYRGVDKGDEVHIYTTAPAASAPEWSNAQCMEFLTVAFRHCNISGDIEMDDIRLGVKMANAAAPAPGGEK